MDFVTYVQSQANFPVSRLICVYPKMLNYYFQIILSNHHSQGEEKTYMHVLKCNYIFFCFFSYFIVIVYFCCFVSAPIAKDMLTLLFFCFYFIFIFSS